MYEKPAMTHVDIEDRLISNETTLVYWVVVQPKTLGTAGTLKIYAGWDTAGKEKARLVTGDGRPFHFYPPIHCDDGLYIDIDTNVSSYTIGYLPEKVALANK